MIFRSWSNGKVLAQEKESGKLIIKQKQIKVIALLILYRVKLFS